jgi:hypothetical protein
MPPPPLGGVPLGVPAAAAPAAAAPRPMTSRRTSSTRRATWSGPDPDEGGPGPGGGGGRGRAGSSSRGGAAAASAGSGSGGRWTIRRASPSSTRASARRWWSARTRPREMRRWREAGTPETRASVSFSARTSAWEGRGGESVEGEGEMGSSQAMTDGGGWGGGGGGGTRAEGGEDARAATDDFGRAETSRSSRARTHVLGHAKRVLQRGLVLAHADVDAPRRRGGRGFRRADVRHRAPGGRGRPSRARRARAVSDLPTLPPGGGGADGPGRSMPLDGARRAAVMKKTRTTRVCGTKTTRPERLSRDPSISPDSNVSGGVALQFVRFPSGRGRALGVHDRARSPPRAPTPRRGRDPRTPRVDRAEASLRRCVPSPRLLAGARSSIDPVVVAYGLLRGPAGVLVDAPSPARSRARRAPLPSP